MNGAQVEIERAFGWRDVGTLLAYVWASIIATLVASAVATVFFLVITAGPFGLMSLVTVVVPIAGMMKASVYVLPLTFFALPLAAVLFPVRRRESLLYILPVVGGAGGALIMAVQAPLGMFVATGAIGGFAAGIAYARQIAMLAVPRLPYVTAANAAIAARLTLRGLGYCGLYAAIGAIASAAAALSGTVFVFVAGMGPVGVLAVAVIPLIPYFGFPIGFALSMPVTFVVLPLLTLFLKNRPSIHLLALGIGGAASGAMITHWWINLSPRYSTFAEAFVVGGAGAGLVAGMVYAGLVRRVRR